MSSRAQGTGGQWEEGRVDAGSEPMRCRLMNLLEFVSAFDIVLSIHVPELLDFFTTENKTAVVEFGRSHTIVTQGESRELVITDNQRS